MLALRSQHTIILLCLVIFIAQLSNVMLLPAISTISNTYQAPFHKALLLIPLFLLPFGLSQLIAGPLSDFIGQRNTLLLSLLIYVISNIAAILSSDINTLLIARTLQGLSAGFLTIMTKAIAKVHHKSNSLTRVLSLIIACGALSEVISPFLSGTLTEHYNWKAIFYLPTILGTFLILLTVQAKLSQHKARPSHQIFSVIEPKLILSSIIFALIFSIDAIIFTTSPSIFQHEFSLSAAEYGSIFALTGVAFIIGSMITAKYSLSKKYLGTSLFLLLLAASVILTIPAKEKTTALILLLLSLAITSVILGYLFPTLSSNALKTIRFKQFTGSASAIIGFIQFSLPTLVSLIILKLPNINHFTLGYSLIIVTLTAILLNRLELKL